MPGGRPKLTEEEKARRAEEKAAKPKGKPGRPKKEKPPPKAVGRPQKTLAERMEEVRTGTSVEKLRGTPDIQAQVLRAKEVTHALPKHIARFTQESEENAMARADASPAALLDLKASRMLPKAHSSQQRVWLEAWVQAHPEADPSLVTALRRRVQQQTSDDAAYWEERQKVIARMKEIQERENKEHDEPLLRRMKELDPIAFPPGRYWQHRYRTDEEKKAGLAAQHEIAAIRLLLRS